MHSTTPVLSSLPSEQRSRLRHAVRTSKLLLPNSPVQVTDIVHHPWNGLIIFLSQDDRKYVAKAGLNPSPIYQEFKNLQRVEHAEPRTPEIIGYQDGVLLQRRVPGHNLQELLDGHEFRAPLLLLKASEELARFHGATRVVDLTGLTNTFNPAVLRDRLLDWKSRILENLSPPADIRVARWRRAVVKIDAEQLVQALGTNAQDAVLCHNDAKPKNFMGDQTGKATIIDLETLSLGSPWWDLAQLAGKLRPRQQKAVLHQYIGHMRKLGSMTDLTSRDVDDRFDAALLYFQMHAAVRCGELQTRDPQFEKPLRAGLDGIRKSVDDDAGLILSHALSS